MEKNCLDRKGLLFIRLKFLFLEFATSAIDAHPPYQGISGDAFGEWTLSLPDTPRLRLEFDVGLQDGSENSDGVTFIVAVQGKEIFRRHYNEQRWEHFSLDLTPYRNQRVTLRFTTTPGPVGNGAWDWAVWGHPEIVSETTNPPTEVAFFLPNEPKKSFPDAVEHQGKGQYSLVTRATCTGASFL